MKRSEQRLGERSRRPALVDARGVLLCSLLVHALLLLAPLRWGRPQPPERPRAVVTLARAEPAPEARQLGARAPRAPAPPQSAPAPPQPAPSAAQVEAPRPPASRVVEEVPRERPALPAPRPPLERSPRRVPERPVVETPTPSPPEPPPQPTPPPQPEPPPAPTEDPYGYVAALYANPSPLPPSAAPSAPTGVADLSELFNRGGGTPGAVRILPLGGDGYSFRARQEAFASLGLRLRQFRSDHTLYNTSDSPIQGVRRERGIERFKSRVPPGEVIQIGVAGGPEELALVDRRMTRMEMEYLNSLGLLGNVVVHQVEYKVVLGPRGYQLVVGNILHSRKPDS